MARKLRLEFEGAIYHVTVRGNGRCGIFRDDNDRERLLWRLNESRDTFGVRVYLYCLMDNHFHLLVETPGANISRFMQSVLTGYTVYFNLRHSRHGHLVQGRYGAQLVDGDDYLRKLSRYIHLNPVATRSGHALSLSQKIRLLRAYRWSSYRGYIDARRKDELVDYGPMLALMQGKQSNRRSAYRDFVELGLAEDDADFLALMQSKPRSIGTREFRDVIDAEIKSLRASMASEADVSLRREAIGLEPNTIVAAVAIAFKERPEDLRRSRRGVQARAVALKMLCKYAGLTQRAAGRLLGYRSDAAVSMALKALTETLAVEHGVRRKVSALESQFLAEGS